MPKITSIVPNSGAPGTEVKINGTGFNDVSSVKFGTVSVESFVVNADKTQITTTVPANITTAKVRVTTPSGTALGLFGLAEGTVQLTGRTLLVVGTFGHDIVHVLSQSSGSLIQVLRAGISQGTFATADVDRVVVALLEGKGTITSSSPRIFRFP